MSDAYKTSEEDFEEFEHLVRKYIDFFGLKDWELGFTHEPCDYMATCGYNEGKRAVFNLGHEWPYDVTPDEIRRTAFHEVCELLMAELWLMGKRYDLSDRTKTDLLDVEVHRIIRRLENCVLKHLPV